jgi:DNA-binding transcriptional ArsR family regulator
MSEERIDAVFSALSDPTRRTVMRAISSRGEASATELAAQLPVSRQAILKHLTALSDAGLVASDRAGRQRRYRLTPQPLGDAMSWMADVGAQWDERLHSLQGYLAARRPTH